MLRLSLALLGAAGLVLAFTEPSSAPVADDTLPLAQTALALDSNPTVLSDAGCKPDAPIDLTLIVPEGARAGRISLDFEVTPRVDVERLSWELVLPPNVLAVDEIRGEWEPQRNVSSRASATVDLPFDGNGYIVGLRVSGVIEGSDETGATFPETVSVERLAVFGEPGTQAQPVLTHDAESDELVTVWAMPARHKVGR